MTSKFLSGVLLSCFAAFYAYLCYFSLVVIPQRWKQCEDACSNQKILNCLDDKAICFTNEPEVYRSRSFDASVE